jgi:tRNA threonylcarbamoyladenosine biosynthesis protein TsaE
MLTNSAKETQKFAKDFAESLVGGRRSSAGAFVVALRGDLGGGKTTFLQGFARGLGIKEKVLSPTFNIYKRYGNFYHFDCYRIEKPEEILNLGFKEIISNPKNIVAIEWAEKIEDILPKNTKWITFEFIDENVRSIDIF